MRFKICIFYCYRVRSTKQHTYFTSIHVLVGLSILVERCVAAIGVIVCASEKTGQPVIRALRELFKQHTIRGLVFIYFVVILQLHIILSDIDYLNATGSHWLFCLRYSLFIIR